MATDNHLPDWDENALSLGVPRVMDTPTLIEWIQRQLETLDETEKRLEEMRRQHREWHQTAPGIFSCCIFTNRQPSFMLTTPNEARTEELYEKALEAFRAYSSGKDVILLDEGMEITNIYADGHVDPVAQIAQPEITYFSRRKDGA